MILFPHLTEKGHRIVVFALLLGLAALAVISSASPAEASQKPHASSKNDSLPSSVDLNPNFKKWGLDRRQQGPRPTCSVFTMTGALEYAVAHRQGKGTRLSVEFLNWAGHHAADRTLDGGFFSELWDGYAQYGICPETDQPYQSTFNVELHPSEAILQDAKKTQSNDLRFHWIKEWNPHTGLTDEQFTEIKRTLSHGWPVTGGFRWPKQAQWEEDVLRMAPPEDVFDGHSVLLIGYKDDKQLGGGGAFLIRNSGGEGKDGYMTYEYVRAYMNDAAWVEAPRK
jgi:hypothetical protein